MAAVAGLRGTGMWGTDERPKNFRELILWRNPNGTAPIFALTARASKESTDDAEFSWWDEPNDLVRLEVNGALNAAATTVAVDSADPTDVAPGAHWGTALNLKAGDILMVEPATDAANFAPEYLVVATVASATSFTVTRGGLGSTAANIADNAFLLKVGSTYAEGTGIPASASRNPIKYHNFTQIWKDTYALTGTAMKTRTRTGDPVKNDRMRKAFDHARDIEWSFLFGRRSEGVGANGQPQRTMGGLRTFISSPTTTVFTAPATLEDLLDAVSPPFDFDSEAGDSRVVFAGNEALNNFNKAIGAQSGSVRVDFSGESKVYGMRFNDYRVPQGTLHIRTHPLLNRHPLYRNSMFLLDFSALKWRPMAGRDTKFFDNVQTKDEDLIRGFWMTEAGLEVRYGGLTCGYVGGLQHLAED